MHQPGRQLAQIDERQEMQTGQASYFGRLDIDKCRRRAVLAGGRNRRKEVPQMCLGSISAVLLFCRFGVVDDLLELEYRQKDDADAMIRSGYLKL